MSEHYLGAGMGTQTNCSCGLIFNNSSEAQQHVNWHLQLAIAKQRLED